MHNERCTPGSGTGAAETTAGNCGIGAAAPCSQQPTAVYDQGRRHVLYPDFTLPRYDGLIVEYMGMPDRPKYMARIRFKQRAYAANAIPALFVYPSDLQGPRWPERLAARIQSHAPRYRSRHYGVNK